MRRPWPIWAIPPQKKKDMNKCYGVVEGDPVIAAQPVFPGYQVT